MRCDIKTLCDNPWQWVHLLKGTGQAWWQSCSRMISVHLITNPLQRQGAGYSTLEEMAAVRDQTAQSLVCLSQHFNNSFSDIHLCFNPVSTHKFNMFCTLCYLMESDMKLDFEMLELIISPDTRNEFQSVLFFHHTQWKEIHIFFCILLCQLWWIRTEWIRVNFKQVYCVWDCFPRHKSLKSKTDY